MFTFLKDQNATIYFLEETYSEQSDESFWRNEWRGEMFLLMALAIVKELAYY